MRFKGWLRSPGETQKGLPVVLDIESTGVTVSTGARQLGWWAPVDVTLERSEGTTFLFRVEDEHWFFEADDPVKVLFNGIPVLDSSRALLSVAARRRAGRGKRAELGHPGTVDHRLHEADRGRQDEPASSRLSVVPSLVWGLLTATLLFGGVLVGVVVGRFQADGRNLITGATVFGALFIGFLWGRMVWQRASRRKAGQAQPIGADGLRPETPGLQGELTSSYGRLALKSHTTAALNGAGAAPPPGSEQSLEVVPDGGVMGPSTEQRSVRVRGNKGLLDLVLGDGFEMRADSEENGPTQKDTATIDRHTPDDLQQIKGIGPATEEILIGLGLTTFEDVALLDAERIAEIQKHLGNFKNRIYTDGWCLTAARLHRQKYGAFPAKKLHVKPGVSGRRRIYEVTSKGKRDHKQEP